MMSTVVRRSVFASFGFVVLMVVIAAADYLGAVPRTELWWAKREPAAKQDQAKVGLKNYRVTIDAKPIVLPNGVHLENLSAVSYDAERDILWTVSNSTPHLFALNKQGEVLRTVRLEGVMDPESVEHMQGNQFAMVDEELQTLWVFELPDDAKVLDVSQSHSLRLGPLTHNNKMFEGLAYDKTNHRLFIGREKDPVSIIEVTGFPPRTDAPFLHVGLNRDDNREQQLFLQDLSALHYDDQTGHLLGLSDEMQMLVEWSEAGDAVDGLSLTAGKHGFATSVPQAEGLAMGPDREIYIISEPNLFYRLDPVAH